MEHELELVFWKRTGFNTDPDPSIFFRKPMGEFMWIRNLITLCRHNEGDVFQIRFNYTPVLKPTQENTKAFINGWIQVTYFIQRFIRRIRIKVKIQELKRLKIEPFCEFEECCIYTYSMYLSKYKEKKLIKNLFFVGISKPTDEKRRIRIRLKCHG